MSKVKQKKDVICTGRLCLSKIIESRITHSEETGQNWIKVGIVLLAQPDKYGNHVIIQHRGKKGTGEEHIPIGNAVRRGEISFEFPHRVPSKIDSRTEREETYRDFNFEDLP